MHFELVRTELKIIKCVLKLWCAHGPTKKADSVERLEREFGSQEQFSSEHHWADLVKQFYRVSLG